MHMTLTELDSRRERDTARLIRRFYGDGRNDIAGFQAAADAVFTEYFRDLRRIAPEQYEARLAELTAPASD